MRKNELLLDKLSQPQNHQLFIAELVFKILESEMHINDLIKKVQRRRGTKDNPSDEARIIKAVGLMIGLGKIKYYKGIVYRNEV